MAATNQILILSSPENTQLIDPTDLISSGYDVVTVSQTQAVESWLKTFLADDLMIIAHPSASEALKYSSEILETHPYIPIILVTSEATLSFLKQSLEIGIFDYLTYPIDSESLLLSII